MRKIKFIREGQLVEGIEVVVTSIIDSEGNINGAENYEVFSLDEADCIEKTVKLAVGEQEGSYWDYVSVTAELPGEAHRDLRPDSKNGNTDQWIKCMMADYVPTSIEGVLRHNFKCTGKLYGCFMVNDKNFTIYYK